MTPIPHFHHMLPRLMVCAALLLSTGGWLLWGRRAEPDSLRAQVVHIWGIKGAQAGELNRPRAIHAAEDGTLFVIDRSGRMQHFTRDGKFLNAWRFPQWQNGTPTSLSADGEGHLVVANTHYSSILTYEQTSALVREFGQRGEGAGSLYLPTDVMVSPDGTHYVLEREPWKDKVMMFTPEGRFISEWGSSGDGPGQFVRPMAIELDQKNRVWIADSCNHRLEAFDLDGKFLFAIGENGTAPGQLDYPYDLALGPNDELVVAEYGNNRIQILRDDGSSLGIIGGPGSAPSRFASPWGVDCDRDGIIWVADTLNDRVQGLRIEWNN